MRSRLLRAGEYMPMADGKIENPEARLDYLSAALDPTDEETVWAIGEFADKADAASRTATAPSSGG